jgi:hypothetical protein
VLVLSAAWWKLIVMIFVPGHYPSAAVTVAAGALWALLAFALVQFLCAPAAWSSMHRWACCFAAIICCVVASDLSSAGWSRPDLIAKFVFQACGMAGCLLLALRLRRGAAHDLRSEV